jgi:cytoskeletal protein RodZ
MSLSELGAYLQRHREEQNLTLEDVEQTTRIRRRYLEAIEAGDWDALPPGVYTRGLLRNYARALGLSADRVLRMYVKERPGEARPPEPQLISQPLVEQPRFNPELVLAMVLMVAAIALLGWIVATQLPGLLPQLAGAGGTPASAQALEDRQTAEPGSVAAATGTAEADSAEKSPSGETEEFGAGAGSRDVAGPSDSGSGSAGGEETSPARDDGEQTEGAGASATARPTTAPRRSTTVAPLPTATKRVTATPAGGLVMTVEATRDTWILVRTDGEQAYADFLLEGESMTWQAEKTLSLRTGNAGGTKVTINGQRVAKLGDMGSVEEREWRLLPNGDIEQREL